MPYSIFGFLRHMPTFLSANFLRWLLPKRHQPKQQSDLRAPGILIAASRRRWKDNQSIHIDDDAAVRLKGDTIWIEAWLRCEETALRPAPNTVTMAVARLPPLARTVIELYQREGLDITTIAKRLGLTPQGARAALIDALVLLDELMSTDEGASTF